MRVRYIATSDAKVDDIEPRPVIAGNEYAVASILAVPGNSIELQIVTGPGELTWHDSTSFETVDPTVPENWVAQIAAGGAVRLAPRRWLAAGFWEAYYDSDTDAMEAVSAELRKMIGPNDSQSPQ